jgi:hypothetical protein
LCNQFEVETAKSQLYLLVGLIILSFSAGVLFMAAFEEWLRSDHSFWLHGTVALLFIFVITLFGRRILART